MTLGLKLLDLMTQVEARLHVGKGEAEAGTSDRMGEDVYGPFSGQVTSLARQALRRAVLEGVPCLVEAMFLCEVTATAEALSGILLCLAFQASSSALPFRHPPLPCLSGILLCLATAWIFL